MKSNDHVKKETPYKNQMKFKMIDYFTENIEKHELMYKPETSRFG